MASLARCRAEHTAFDLDNVACMTWAGNKVGSGKLYIYLVGGRFTALEGLPARLVWERFVIDAEDVIGKAYGNTLPPHFNSRKSDGLLTRRV